MSIFVVAKFVERPKILAQSFVRVSLDVIFVFLHGGSEISLTKKTVRTGFLGVAIFAFISGAEVEAQIAVKIGIISPTFGHAFYVARGRVFRNEGLVGSHRHEQ
jgi:hypothetical protein